MPTVQQDRNVKNALILKTIGFELYLKSFIGKVLIRVTEEGASYQYQIYKNYKKI